MTFTLLRRAGTGLALVALLTAAGCGGSGASSSSSSTPAATSPATASGGASTTSSGASTGGALSAEATSAATGDIPDTQAFVKYANPALGYSMSYPEGWAQSGAGGRVTIQDKNNIVRITARDEQQPTVATVAAEIAKLKASTPTLTAGTPSVVALKSGPAIKVTYSTQSAPNPVTTKRVLLNVDRYELTHSGKTVVVELGSPQGVDNIDAYKMMINSFKWQ
jgi:hypothetical protein